MKKVYSITVFLLLGYFCSAQSINLALHQSYTASIMDSITTPFHNPRLAFDGDTNSAYHPQAYPVQWIAVHFQSPVDVDSLSFWYGQSPGGNTTQEIYSTEDSLNWSLVETFHPYHTIGGGSYILQLSARLEGSKGIRIRTTVNPSWIQWKEIKVWGLYTNTCFVTIYDTVFTEVFDTTHVIINDTITTEVFDTTHVIINDTVVTEVFDTSYVTVQDTVTTEVFDTTVITVYDSISVTDTLIIDAVLTGIDPPHNINTLKIYPNPAKDHVFINTGEYPINDGYRIKIYSQLGATVFETSVEQPLYEINLSTWEGKGMYFVQLIDDGGQVIDTRKIILQ